MGEKYFIILISEKIIILDKLKKIFKERKREKDIQSEWCKVRGKKEIER